MKHKRPENQFALQSSAYLLAQHPPAQNGYRQSEVKLAEETEASPQTPPVILPEVRVPVWVKITLPYFLLALFVALAGAYVTNRIVLDSTEERFANQLIEAGKLAADQMVQHENRLLET